MPRLEWDKVGERLYETGVEQGVLYVMDDEGAYGDGVAWNGLTNVEENPSGAEETVLYADDLDYLSLRSKEKWAGTINAYTYPEQFEACDGSKQIVAGVVAGQQSRSKFGLVYKTLIGNDTKGEDYGYKIHIVYNCSASVSSKTHQTVNESPEAVEFSWEVTSNAIKVENIPDMKFKPMSTIVIDSTKFADTTGKAKLEALEDVLFGTDPGVNPETDPGTDPMLPTPKEIYDLLK